MLSRLPPALSACLSSAAATVVGLAVIVAAGCGGEEKSGPTSTPAATVSPSSTPGPAPSPTAAPLTVAGLLLRTWTLKEPAPLPQDTVIYMEKGCTQCDGPTAALERVANIGNPGDETLSVEMLFTAPGGSPAYISSFAFGTNGSDTIYLTVCSRGYCGGLGEISEGAQATLYRSLDGGISWEALWTREGSWGIGAVTAESVTLANHSTGSYWPPEFVDLNGAPLDLTPPEPGATFWGFRTFGYFIWRLADRATFVNSGGEVLFAPPSGLRFSEEGISLSGAYNDRNAGGFVIRWRDGNAGYQGMVRGGKLEAVYGAKVADLQPYTGVWIDATHAVGTVWLTKGDLPDNLAAALASGGANVPVLMDFERAELTPLLLYGPISSEAYRGRNVVVGWEQDTFWRVATGGTCLNLRERPTLSAPAVACYQDGVLLGGAGKEPVTDETGTVWGAMEGPGGIDGWVAMEFVVRR